MWDPGFSPFWGEIVGVAGNVQVRPGWGDNGPISTMPLSYLPLAQMTDGFLRLVHGWFAPAFIVRSTMPVNTTAIELRRALDTVDPLLPFARVQRISDLQATALAQQRFLVALLVALAACAALLSAIGLHGVIATSVTERTREMGIRLALGATRRQAVGSLVLPAIGLAALGTMLGMIAAGTLAPLLRHFLWGVSASDPATFAGVAALLLAVAIAASISPALKILRLDPALTLRQE